jgi:hypothetical protein
VKKLDFPKPSGVRENLVDRFGRLLKEIRREILEARDN